MCQMCQYVGVQKLSQHPEITVCAMYLSPHQSRPCVGLGRSMPSDESVLTLRIAFVCFPEQLDIVMLSVRCSCCPQLIVYLALLGNMLAFLLLCVFVVLWWPKALGRCCQRFSSQMFRDRCFLLDQA